MRNITVNYQCEKLGAIIVSAKYQCEISGRSFAVVDIASTLNQAICSDIMQHKVCHWNPLKPQSKQKPASLAQRDWNDKETHLIQYTRSKHTVQQLNQNKQVCKHQNQPFIRSFINSVLYEMQMI